MSIITAAALLLLIVLDSSYSTTMVRFSNDFFGKYAFYPCHSLFFPDHATFFVKMLAFISKEGLLLKTNYVSAGQRFAIIIRFPVLKWGSRQNLIEIIITAVRSPVQGYWVQ